MLLGTCKDALEFIPMLEVLVLDPIWVPFQYGSVQYDHFLLPLAEHLCHVSLWGIWSRCWVGIVCPDFALDGIMKRFGELFIFLAVSSLVADWYCSSPTPPPPPQLGDTLTSNVMLYYATFRSLYFCCCHVSFLALPFTWMNGEILHENSTFYFTMGLECEKELLNKENETEEMKKYRWQVLRADIS